jgi:hypothetical protein
MFTMPSSFTTEFIGLCCAGVAGLALRHFARPDTRTLNKDAPAALLNSANLWCEIAKSHIPTAASSLDYSTMSPIDAAFGRESDSANQDLLVE